MEESNTKSSGITVQEAGRKGGQATARTHDRTFYQEIGRKGGKATASSHGHEFFEEIGRRGGQHSHRSDTPSE
jgi:uncharacterized protein